MLLFTILTVAINIFFKEQVEHYTHGLHLPSKSKERVVIMVVFYLLSFFNATILPILLSIRLSEKDYPLLSQIFYRGEFEDFSTGWYQETGKILISTMKASALLPLIMLGASIIKYNLSLWMDRSCRCRQNYRTKYTSV